MSGWTVDERAFKLRIISRIMGNRLIYVSFQAIDQVVESFYQGIYI